MKIIYVGVGFKVNRSRSIFYIKEQNPELFFQKLLMRTLSTDPDFVSIRRAKLDE